MLNRSWSRNHRRFLMLLRSAAASSILFAFALPSFSIIHFCSPKDAAQNIQIRTLYSGRPAAGSTIEVYASSPYCTILGPTLYKVVSDDRGIAKLPQLAVGSYEVIAWVGEKANDEINLNVLPSPTSETSHLDMNLWFDFPPGRAQILGRAEHQPITQRFKQLQGQLFDPTEARIPGASIEIIPKNESTKNRVIKLTSDKQGSFSANLSNGDYIAFVTAPGFKQHAIPFTIDKSASSTEFTIYMSIAFFAT